MIEDISFVLLYLFVLLVGTILYKKACGSLFSPSILMLFFWHYLILVYSGTIFIYFDVFEQYVNIGVINKNLIWFVWINVSIGFIVIPFTYLLLSKIKISNKVNILYYYVKKYPPIKTHSNITLLIIFAICIAVFILYLNKIPSIPLALALSGADPTELAMARSAAGNDFPGKYHRYALFFLEIAPFLVYVTYVEYRITLKKLFFLLFPFAILVSVISITKFSFFRIILVLIFIRLLLGNSSISRTQLIKYISLFTIALILMYALFMGLDIRDKGGSDVFAAIAGRILGGQIVPLYFYYEAFPRHFDFLWGQSFPNPAGILPFEQFRLTVEMMYYIKPEFIKLGLVGSMPTVFWGEIYANFGHMCAYLSMVIVGAILFFTENIITPFAKKSFLGVALYGYIAMHLTKLTQSGLTYLFADFYLWGVIISALLLHYLSKGFNQSMLYAPNCSKYR